METCPVRWMAYSGRSIIVVRSFFINDSSHPHSACTALVTAAANLLPVHLMALSQHVRHWDSTLSWTRVHSVRLQAMLFDKPARPRSAVEKNANRFWSKKAAFSYFKLNSKFEAIFKRPLERLTVMPTSFTCLLGLQSASISGMCAHG